MASLPPLPHTLIGTGPHKPAQGRRRARLVRRPRRLRPDPPLDPALDAEVMQATWLRWYRDAELVVLPAAGHYPMEETPLQLVTAVEDFLRLDEPERSR